MTTQLLIAVVMGRQMGRLKCGNNLDIYFEYDEGWQRTTGAFPLSHSMPLIAKSHPSRIVTPFLWGLLPDSDAVLEQWAKTYHISSRNPFALLSHVGEDCAGAVQFVRPDRLDAVLSGDDDKIDWLTDKDVEERLKALRQNHAAGRHANDHGQFSLAGAQPKTALIRQEGRWGIPSGSIPTTHILKPPTGAYDGLAENEHFCLCLAKEIELPVAHSEVGYFGKEVAFITQRYDRQFINDKVIRIHQEDFCQVLGVMPHTKYENEGGPGVEKIITALQRFSGRPQEDILTFVKACILNWLIAGTDGHAKNYALLFNGESSRLAPLYDIISTLPYDDIPIQKAKLAMKIGDEYRLTYIQMRHWLRMAKTAGIHEADMQKLLKNVSHAVQENSVKISTQIKEQGITHPILDILVKNISERTRRLQDI